MKIKKYLYKISSHGGWRYIIQCKSTYVISRAKYEDILPIYEECKQSGFDIEKMEEIKKKYKSLKEQDPMKYVCKNQRGYYFIMKGGQYFCCAKTLDKIMEYKKQLKDNGWDKSKLDYNYRKKHNLPKYIQKNRNGSYSLRYKSQHWGTFKNLQDAIKERDLLMEHDWDYGFVDLY